VPQVAEAFREGTALAGTIDTWLIWNFTKGKIHATDVTNASRTMLMNLKTLDWEENILNFFGVPRGIMPSIKSSSDDFGQIHETFPLGGVPITGVLGDQQSALVGQLCLQAGQAKNTYGTGCFLLYNTGKDIVPSKHGLLTTVAYKLSPSEPAYYALEGSVAVAGIGVQWLRDNLGLINTIQEVEQLAASVEDCGGIYFVPAFSGLFAPYWRNDARGLVIGLTYYTKKAHFARALLEAVAYQTGELMEAMKQDSGNDVISLRVDGGMSKNELLMQIQADLLGIPVERPANTETTALGAALVAGLAVGVFARENIQQIPVKYTTFSPTTTEEQRKVKLLAWKNAVKRSFDWV